MCSNIRSTAHMIALAWGTLLGAPMASGQFVADLPAHSVAVQSAVLRSTYRIHNNGTGTAFLIHHDVETGIATALTPLHCVPHPAAGIVLERFDEHWPYPSQVFHHVSVVAIDAEDNADVAVIQFNAGAHKLPTLELRSGIPPLPAECFSVGCAGGSAASVTPRVAVGVHRRSGKLIVNSPAIGGQSGSPLVYGGQVVGMLLSTDDRESWFANLDRMRAAAGMVLPTYAMPEKPAAVPTTAWAISVIKLIAVTALANRQWPKEEV